LFDKFDLLFLVVNLGVRVIAPASGLPKIVGILYDSDSRSDHLSRAGSSWRPVWATVNPCGRTIFVADAHRDGNRLVVRADEKLTAFVQLELAARVCGDVA
jgi:hypothetical protein